MPDHTVTAIIVSYNSEGVIRPCVEALLAQGVKALVVDNASADGTVEIAESCGAEVVRNPNNEGFGRANNIGAHLATSEYLLFINPDAVVDEGAVATLLATAVREPEGGLFGPKLVEPDGRIYRHETGVLGEFLSGACLLIRREVFIKLGGFDPQIFLFYEDDDLCRRVKDAGYGLHYVEEAVVRHLRGGSSGKSKSLNYTVRWHQAWSQFYVARKYGIEKAVTPWLLHFGLKYIGAWVIWNMRRKRRYAGSFAGAWAFARGETSLRYQGLE